MKDRVFKSLAVINFLLLCCFWSFSILAQAEVSKASTLKQPEAKRKSGFKGEYFLTRSEDPVCVSFTKNLNQFRELDFDECSPRLSENFPEFSRPEWREVPLELEIAEKAFKDLSLEYEQSKEDMERKWQHWLQETVELRASGQVKMWLSEVDINNDGTPDPIARVQYAHPASGLPVKQRGCVYSHSGLRYLPASSSPFFGPFKHFYFGRNADIIYYSKTQRFYSVEWSEGQVGPILQGQEIGATRGVLVGLSREARESLGPVCYINWVPTGKYRPLQRKNASSKSAN